MTRSNALPETAVPSDRQLIAKVRGGDLEAYDGLYSRHFFIASAVAHKNVDNPSDAEDVVAEAFQSVLQSLVAGKGPDNFFRAYLLSTVTRISHHRNRKSNRALPTSDEMVLDRKLTPTDPVIQNFETHTVSKAFRALPERWQSALWYLDIERMKPAAVGPILGLSANAVSALGVRAREGLRRQYLQMHVSDMPEDGCTAFASQLGNYLRGGLSAAAEAKVADHLEGCAKCTAALLELKDIQGTMRVVLLPLVTGVSAAGWSAGGPGLGTVGQLPALTKAGGLAAIPSSVKVVAAAVFGVGLVLGTIGLIDTAPGPAERDTYQGADVQRTQTALPVPSVPPLPEPEPRVTVEAAPLPAPSASNPQKQPVGTSPAPVTPVSAPPPAGAAYVKGTARRTDSGADPRTATLEVIFSLSKGGGLGRATVEFSIARYASFRSGAVSAPDGWSCALVLWDPARINCTTTSVQPGELKFGLMADMTHLKHSHVSRLGSGRSGTTLRYGLAGSGIEGGPFSFDF